MLYGATAILAYILGMYCPPERLWAGMKFVWNKLFGDKPE